MYFQSSFEHGKIWKNYGLKPSSYSNFSWVSFDLFVFISFWTFLLVSFPFFFGFLAYIISISWWHQGQSHRLKATDIFLFYGSLPRKIFMFEVHHYAIKKGFHLKSCKESSDFSPVLISTINLKLSLCRMQSRILIELIMHWSIEHRHGWSRSLKK